MKKIGKYLVICIAMLASAVTVSAQDPAFNAVVDKQTVAVGDPFNVKFTIENGRGDITPPDLSDFTVVFGPSRSSSFQIINGQQTSNMTLSYTLRAKSEGKFSIGSAVAKVGSKLLKSDPIEIEVVKGSAARNSGAARENRRPPQDKNLIVRMLLSKTKVYQGEGVVITFELLSRYNNIDLGETSFPSLNGFWSEDIKTGQTSWEQDYEYIDRVPYRKAILRKKLLFPQRPGTIEIDPFKVSARVNKSFFNAGTEVGAQSYAQKIEVLPLPGGAPESFNGAVGEFDFSGKAGPTEIRANDAVDLTLEVKGRGNLKLVKAPSIEFPTDFEVYDPEINDRISVSGGGMNGSRTYEYLVIPRYAGKYNIPEIAFTAFSPSKGKYITHTAGPFDIEVSGEDGLVPSEESGIARNRVEPVRQDIRYIVTDPEMLHPAGDMFFKSFGFYLLTIGPLLFLTGFILFHKKRDAILGDVKTLRRKKAHSVAKKRLAAAEKAMSKGDSTTFYAEIFNAVYGFLSDKLGTGKAALTKPVIREKLAENNVPDHMAQEVIYLIETCEMARFAPVTEQSDEVFYSRTADFIEKLEGLFK